MTSLLEYVATITLFFYLHQAGAGLFKDVMSVTVCPKEDSQKGCRTIQQLVTNPKIIKSHTTLRFIPSTFNLRSDTILTIANLSNITLDVTAPPARANLTCIGNNSGFMFDTISGLVIRNLNFDGCGGRNSFHDSHFTVALSECTDVIIENIMVRQGSGYGVVASNTKGILNTTNALFIGMNGTSFCVLYDVPPFSKQSEFEKVQTVHITIAKTKFSSTTCVSNLFSYNGIIACVIGIALWNDQLAFNLHLVDITITNITHGFDVSDVFISSESPQVNSILLEGFISENNSVISSGGNGAVAGSDFSYIYSASGAGSVTTIEIINSMLVNNIYKYDNFDPFYVFYSTTCGISFFNPLLSSKQFFISIINTTIANNTGEYGTAICTQFLSDDPFNAIILQLINSTVANNSIYSSDYYKKGAVVLKNTAHFEMSGCSFLNNSGTGLLLQNSHVILKGRNVFRGNKGYNGGGIALWDSSIELASDAIAHFEDNVAEHFGAGLYVKSSVYLNMSTHPDKRCFITKQHRFDSYFRFYNNSAKTAGNDLYGGHLFKCLGSKAVAKIIRSVHAYALDVTSDPFHICDCSLQNSEACMDVPQKTHSVHTYPGKTFNLSLLAVGQLVQGIPPSGVPTAIYASLLPPTSIEAKPGSISIETSVQNGGRACSILKYQVNSTNKKEVMVLTVNDNANNMEKDYFVKLWQDASWKEHVGKLIEYDLVVPIFVEIDFLDCPIGFEHSRDGACTCSMFIKDYAAGCSIDKMMIEKKPLYWLGLDSHTNSSKQDNTPLAVYLAHKHCPFDYCRPGSFEFSFKDPDAQCNHNRMGTLCGACKPSYSLVIGGIECRKCTHFYLLLLIPFALAGIILVIFLSLTDMTVAAGTINSLIFYANIISDNKTVFFSQEYSQSFLSVFIAWLNLDLGVNSCFYDGLDAYVYTWLQLAFPLYLWLLALCIVVACRHLAFMNKVCGRNIVPVLATLFLLSYTKLQNAITTGMSCTVVEVSSGENLLVWLKDGNVLCFQGKHLALFLVSCVFLLILLAYTLSIVLGPWLQKMTHYHVFFWVLKLKPLFDAYFGPLKDKHRYWIGVLLLSRLILCLVSAVNVLGDTSINLLAICTVCFILVALLWQSGGVYKSWTFSLIDTFFIINLGVLSSIVLSDMLTSSKSQNITISLFTGSSFALLCLIIFYHCFSRLKQLYTARYHRPLLEYDENKSDVENNDLIRAVDENRDHAATERNASLNADIRVDETY